jgi:hypothetical protein
MNEMERRKKREKSISVKWLLNVCINGYVGNISYVWSFKIDTNLPVTFHTNTEPSAAPAAM